MFRSTEVHVSPIRNDIARLDALSGAAAQLTPARQPAAGPEAFSDFGAFAAEGAVRLGQAGASLDPVHAARAVVAHIAEV